MVPTVAARLRALLPHTVPQRLWQRRVCSSAAAILASNRVSPRVSRTLDAALSGQELSVEDAEHLFQATGDDLRALTATADEVRKTSVGSDVSYVVNRNINYTNVCIKRCGFCAFSRTGIDQEGYFLPIEEVTRRAVEAAEMGASEVCIQAGLPPNMDGSMYARICVAIKARLPSIHIHAFSPEEVLYGASRARVSIRDYLLELKQAGVDSLPGTSAEILDDELRHKVSRGRLSVNQWVEVVSTAHSIGLPTTATMMYGFCENPRHLAQHLVLLRDIQKKAQGSGAGFTEFVPLGFVASEAPMWRLPKYKIEGLRAGPTGIEVLRAHAVARLVLNPNLAGGIKNIQISWVKEGLKMAQLLLDAGANDLGGTLINESISSAAGSAHGQIAKPSQLRRLVWELGPERSVIERTTTYGTRRRFQNPIFYDLEGLELAEVAARDTSSNPDSHLDGPDSEAILPLEDVQNTDQAFGSFDKLCKSADFRFDGRRQACGAVGTMAAGKKGGSSSRARSFSTTADHEMVADSLLFQGAHLQGNSLPVTVPTSTSQVITYSPSFTVVPTYECFNVCSYCNFRANVTKDGRDWLSVERARDILSALSSKPSSSAKHPVVAEVLVMAGEVHPRAPNRGAWIDRIEAICIEALAFGFLPHTNVGPLACEEMSRLRGVNASMGLMVEQTAQSLTQRGGVHYFAPSKSPEIRLQQLRQAGEMQVPFTTGMLVGIGETPGERLETLEAIATVAAEFGHVQEVILQPHSLGSTQRLQSSEAMRWSDEATTSLPALVRAAKSILPSNVGIQIPPNLVLHRGINREKGSQGLELMLRCLQEGASDLGGISPKDEVNPDYEFPLLDHLHKVLGAEGYILKPRLPVYPRLAGWLPEEVQQVLRQVQHNWD